VDYIRSLESINSRLTNFVAWNESKELMARFKLDTAKKVLTSPYWLVLTLTGAFFSFFALNRGGIVVFIEIGFGFFLMNLIAGEYPIKKIPLTCWVILTICAYLLLGSILVAPQDSHYRWMANLVRMLGVVFAIHCLSQKRIDPRIHFIFPLILSLTVCVQFAARYGFGRPHGTFSNPHYLASVAILILPLLFYYFWKTPGWWRYIFIPIAVMDIELLLRTESRPAFIGITFGILFVIFFLIQGRRKWFGLTLIFLFLVTLYLSGYADFKERIHDLFVNLSKDERAQYYTFAWNVLKENTLLSWIFGNGIGYFPVIYVRPSDAFVQNVIFPHFFLLEILYLNGLFGVLLIFGGLSGLIAYLVYLAKNTRSKNGRLFITCMIVVFIAWLIHCGLTFPFYSKYSIYPLAFILGVSSSMVRNDNN
jgi:hypothetical protein